MPIPLIVWGGVALVGVLGGTAYVAGEAGDKLANLAKWSAVAGGVYVSYRALQAGGVLK